MILVFCLILAGCAAHTHIIGKGSQSGVKTQARQWYILFGLVPLNNVDTGNMSGGASDYTIKTKTGFLDVVLNIVTGNVTVCSRTVSVTK
jgi:hypothetical protein